MHTPASEPHILSAEFFARDSVSVARDLLGKIVVSTAGGTVTSGRIVETEAYLGADDPGSHAATKGITRRNAVMYGPPGHAYVYFTYGNHHMLNLVTGSEGVAGAVLIRAIEPIEGIETMARRRAAGRRTGRPLSLRDLGNGPGKLAAALGIGLEDNGTRLDGRRYTRRARCGGAGGTHRVIRQDRSEPGSRTRVPVLPRRGSARIQRARGRESRARPTKRRDGSEVKLRDIYSTCIEAGKQADPRSPEELQRVLRPAKKAYEKLDDDDKPFYDAERLTNPTPTRGSPSATPTWRSAAC